MDIHHVWISTSVPVVHQLVNFKFRTPDCDASDDEPEESNLDNRSSNPITRDQEMLPEAESDPLDTQVDLSMLTCLHFLAAEKPPPYDWEDDFVTPPSPPGPRLQEKLGSAADYFQLFFDNDFIQQVSYSVILLYKSYQIFQHYLNMVCGEQSCTMMELVFLLWIWEYKII